MFSGPCSPRQFAIHNMFVSPDKLGTEDLFAYNSDVSITALLMTNGNQLHLLPFPN